MLSSFLAVIVYSIIVLVYLLLSILYFYAWKKMKHTPVIGFLSLLFTSIFIDNIFWFAMEFYRFTQGNYSSAMITPEILVLIKSILAIGLVMFAYISVKTQDKDIKV